MSKAILYYVYELAYPESMGGAVFYVGKGVRRRINAHESEARLGKQSYKCDIIRDIWAHGEQVVKRKVFETPIEQDAYIYEWVLVNLVYGYDNLANVQDGGDGRRSKLPKKQVSFTLSIDLVEHIYQQEVSLSGAFRKVMPIYLQQESINSIMSNIDVLNRLSYRVINVRRQPYIFLAYPDTCDLLKTIPNEWSTCFVEYCLRDYYDFHLTDDEFQKVRRKSGKLT
jgi:hypothetical protein